MRMNSNLSIHIIIMLKFVYKKATGDEQAI